MNKQVINYELLNENGKLIKTAMDGTCQLWRYNNIDWVVLPDNSVITLDEDNSADDDDEIIFPYSQKHCW